MADVNWIMDMIWYELDHDHDAYEEYMEHIRDRRMYDGLVTVFKDDVDDEDEEE